MDYLHAGNRLSESIHQQQQIKILLRTPSQRSAAVSQYPSLLTRLFWIGAGATIQTRMHLPTITLWRKIGSYSLLH